MANNLTLLMAVLLAIVVTAAADEPARNCRSCTSTAGPTCQS